MAAPPSTKLLKRELRKRIRAALSALPPPTLLSESAATTLRFLSSPTFASCTSIAAYSSMSSEFDTSTLLSAVFASEKRLFLPRVLHPPAHSMTLLETHSAADLASFPTNSWGIHEPPLSTLRTQAPDDTTIDVIVVPGLAFDSAGRRCGQGMGFYDTYLRRYRDSGRRMPRLVALALNVQMVDEVPTSEDDWPMDEVLYAGQDEAAAG